MVSLRKRQCRLYLGKHTYLRYSHVSQIELIKDALMQSVLEQNQGLKHSIASFCNAQDCFGEFGISSVESYEWPKKGLTLDDLLKKYDPRLRISGANNYEKNVALKQLLSDQCQDDQVDLMKLSEWIIKDWGGIRTLSKNMENYVNHAIMKSYPSDLMGVASYSKLFAMFYPREFAIYDARVAVSLNIIQIMSSEKDGTFFPYLMGRNKVTGDQGNGRGFAKISAFNRKNIAKTSQKPWRFLDKRDVYPTYNKILCVLCEENNWNLWDIEMLLFSKAESLVWKIKSDPKFSDVDWSPLHL